MIYSDDFRRWVESNSSEPGDHGINDRNLVAYARHLICHGAYIEAQRLKDAVAHRLVEKVNDTLAHQQPQASRVAHLHRRSTGAPPGLFLYYGSDTNNRDVKLTVSRDCSPDGTMLLVAFFRRRMHDEPFGVLSNGRQAINARILVLG